MTALLDQLAGLRRQIEDARSQRAREEYALEQSRAGLATVTVALQQEFGVSSPEEARALLEQLEREGAAEVSSVQAYLAAAEGGSAA